MRNKRLIKIIFNATAYQNKESNSPQEVDKTMIFMSYRCMTSLSSNHFHFSIDFDTIWHFQLYVMM